MGIIGSRKIADYIAAFAHFGGLNHTYHTRPFGRHALINDSIEIYQVSHISDLVADYRTYFKADYSEIYLQFPAELWDALLLEKFHLVPDDVIIELYKSWKSFWRGQLPNISKQDEDFLILDLRGKRNGLTKVITRQFIKRLAHNHFISEASKILEVTLAED